MKRKRLFFKIPFLILLLALTGVSCSRLTKVKDLVTQPTAREKYQRDFEKNSPLLSRWEEESEKALLDSVLITLPYSEAGYFSPRTYPVYSYDITLDQGERLQVKTVTDSSHILVFLDLFQQKKTDSTSEYELIKSAEYESVGFQEEISEAGIYKLLIQPEIEADTPFSIEIYKEPTYLFPVVSAGNSAIQSYWGADRDAGRRSHEGIDIFASRGTPVIAVTAGRVSSTANKGLGGKQVWLRDSKRGHSLYYAHLDSIIAVRGMRVFPGDTLGLVGNTGNARTTAPHLHFGIYNGYRGARNPLPFVFQIQKPESIAALEVLKSDILISSVAANMRKGPSTASQIGGKTKPKDTLKLLGRTSGWYHVRQNEENFFIHQSLASPL
ncbi:peptidoglycan DD-metalloendopeptidase family protein [Salinimicrobium flavum]|uniref:Peptidoglycan DD-metalloendopeptidase family protein n=1 Tax=Salinimicrobium flavum TaxID=1737065 RepID=A0ABW5ITZ1_9FLAO